VTGPAVAFFDAVGTIRNNIISGMDTAIESNQWSTSGGTTVTITGNTISNVRSGIITLVPAAGTVISGNAITIDGTAGEFDRIGITVRNATGAVTVADNDVSATGDGAGMWMFGNSVPVVVTGNRLTATGSVGGSAGLATGIFMTDDGRIAGDADGNPVGDLSTYATISGNTISGFATGIELYRNGQSGGTVVQATIGGVAANSITTAAGGTGIRVYDLDGSANGYDAVAAIQNNTGTISGAAVGIDVVGGSATISGNAIYGNATGVRFTAGGTGSVTGNDFDGAVDNSTDVWVDSTAGAVAIGAGNSFAGDTYFIDNQSAQSFELTGYGSGNFEGLDDNFRIEDRMHHRMDTDLAATTGLITWVAGKVYVTNPAIGAGSTDSSIQRGIDAASAGDTVNLEDGTFTDAAQVVVNKSLTIVGAGMGTGGTITGVGRRLKEQNPACHVFGVEPRLGVHVQGLKSLEDGFIPPVLDEDVLDGKIIVGNRHAFSHARRAMLAEGLFGGISSGAVLHAAMRAAGRLKRGNIVMVFADAGWKYLGTDLWQAGDHDPAIEAHEDPLDDVLWW